MALPVNSPRHDFSRDGHFPAQRRPKMLKDLLLEDLHSPSSREYVRSIPQQSFESTVRELITLDLKPAATSALNAKTLLRNQSKAASATMSKLQTMLKVVKAIPKTLSRQSSQRNCRTQKVQETATADARTTVTIKDIIGWKSFRGVAVEVHHPPPPPDCTTTTTISTASTSSSKGSSWCDSDFTADYSPLWCGNNGKQNYENEVKLGENLLPFVGEDSVEKRERSFSAMEMEPKRESLFEVNKQQSPLSVIDFEAGDDGEWYCSFSQSTSDAEIQEAEEEEDQDQESHEAEEKAKELLNQVKSSVTTLDSCKFDVDWLLLDFFRSELSEIALLQASFDNLGADHHLVKTAQSWLRGDCDQSYEWSSSSKKTGYIRDMDRGERWSKFREEEDEMIVGIESEVLSLLVDELFEEASEA